MKASYFNDAIDAIFKILFGWCGQAVHKWNYITSSLLSFVLSFSSLVFVFAITYHLFKEIIFKRHGLVPWQEVFGLIFITSFCYLNWRLRLFSKSYIDI